MSKPMRYYEFIKELDKHDYSPATVLSIAKKQFDAIRAQERQACADRYCKPCIMKRLIPMCADCAEIQRIKGETP
jgi:hypothetical protein